MTSQQGLIAHPSTAFYPQDYYGRPTYWECLMRFDFDQEGEPFPSRWRPNYPGQRPLGIAPSGRFAIYLIRWIPRHMTRAQVAVDLRVHIPPTDRFTLSFLDTWEWRREKVVLPLLLPAHQVPVEVKHENHHPTPALGLTHGP